MPDLAQKLAHLPRRSGVYLMKDRHGKILYVGKAKRLDHRVRSYFQAGGTDHPKQAALVSRIQDVETIVTDSDVEALLLEMTLIKEKRPPYNIQLKDDKRFPFLKITLDEDYPKAVITRRTPRDGSRYFGPYTDAGALRRTLKMVRAIFPIRSCMGERPGRGPHYRECLDYHIHRCAAPCIGEITREEYREVVDRLILFLGGQGEEVLTALRRDMAEASEELQFERAARLRDRIQGVERLMRRQKMLDVQERDLDVFAFARSGDTAYGAVLQVRGGTVLGKETRRLRGTGGRTDPEVMAAFLSQYYRDRDSTPGEIVAAVEPADVDVLTRWLSSRSERTTGIRVPQRGRFAGLARLAEENARLDLEEARGESARGGLDPAVYALQKVLDLPRPPAHVEGFDISNIQGTNPVASMVVFRNGRPARSAYRRYKMNYPEGPNDFAMMAEVVGRRAARIVAGEFPAPDLILIDGGAGQVGAAVTALEQEGLAEVPVVGLAKREEEIVFPGRRRPLKLPRTDEGLRLLIRVRDEAHRFAVTFHRQRRGKAALASRLDAVPGIGTHRKILLLNAFGSTEAVERATPDELARVPGIGHKVAERVHAALHGPERGSDAA
jgi:excinuclease ABC subunit C